MKEATIRANLAPDRESARQGCTGIGQSTVDGRHASENKALVTAQKLLTEEIVGSKNPHPGIS